MAEQELAPCGEAPSLSSRYTAVTLRAALLGYHGTHAGGGPPQIGSCRDPQRSIPMRRWRTALSLAVVVFLSGSSTRWPHGSSARAQGPALDRHGNPLPAGAVARMGGLRFRHGDRILRVAFSPDGKRVISGGLDDGMLRLWDVQTGKELRGFRG